MVLSALITLNLLFINISSGALFYTHITLFLMSGFILIKEYFYIKEFKLFVVLYIAFQGLTIGVKKVEVLGPDISLVFNLVLITSTFFGFLYFTFRSDKLRIKNANTLKEFSDELEISNERRTKALLVTNQTLQDQLIQLNESKERNVKLQEKLIANAYQEGFAENAVSILHNIGNALTGIIMTSSENKNIRSLKTIPNLISVFEDKMDQELKAKNLENFLVNDVKGKEFLPLLKKIGAEIENVYDNIHEDFQSINKQLGGVSEIISLQQNYANLRNKVRTVEPLQVIVEDVINLHRKGLEKNNIQFVINLSESRKIFIEKNGLAQALGNFVQNAGQAILERKRLDPGYFGGSIQIKTYVEDDRIYLLISDDGIGIKDSVKGEIFKFGFTTKLEGSGFGLHSCYNFVKGNEGVMTIESAGQNMGAVVKVGFKIVKDS